MPESQQGTVKLYKAPPAITRYHRKEPAPPMEARAKDAPALPRAKDPADR